jgi:hypothetical protein
MKASLTRLSTPMVLLVAVISLGVLGDGIFLVSHYRNAGQATTQADKHGQSGSKSKAQQHPCNHGFYVSQAAHAKKGGAYVKQVAQSDLGKNGDCSAPLPAPNKTSTTSADKTDETDNSDD